jgi:hypothetical protein
LLLRSNGPKQIGGEEIMTVRTIVGVAVVAACTACTSNKPAEEPSHYTGETAQTEVTTPETRGSTSNEYERPSTSEESATSAPERSSDEERARGAGEPQGRAAVPPAPQATAAQPPAQPPAQPAPDNTRMNERDRAAASVTPMNQGNNETDLRTTQRIRQAVMADDSLSFSAKNVKIITSNGKVTLKGVVESDDERKAIDDEARKVAGDANVDDRIEVKK